MTVRERVGWRLRCWADRIDPDRAFRASSMWFTYENNRGSVINDRGRGCRLWYYGPDYDRAHTESDTPHPRVNWETLTVDYPGGNR